MKSSRVNELKLLSFASDSCVEIRAMVPSLYCLYCLACSTEATRRLFQVGAMQWLAVVLPADVTRLCSHCLHVTLLRRLIPGNRAHVMCVTYEICIRTLPPT